MPVKRKPTVKQLRARAKFVKMVKARARAASATKRKAGYRLKAGKWIAPKAKRAVKRGKRNPLKFGSEAAFGKWQQQAKKSSGGSVPRSTAKKSRVTVRKRKQKVGALGRLFSGSGRLGLGRSRTTYRVKRNPVSVTKNGRKLYGAAAQAVLASRVGRKRNTTTRQRGVLLSGRKANPKRRANKGFWSGQIKRAVSRRLSAPIGRRRNSGAPADIQEMHEKFLGRPSEDSFDITAPQGTPKDVAVLGSLVCLKTEDEDFDFDKGEAFLGADGRGNLYVLGDTTPVEANENFGHIEEIRYEAKKDHLNPFQWRRRKSRRNSSNVEYFHYFGEEDGVMPKLKSDGDGMLHISGGNYHIEPEGIVN